MSDKLQRSDGPCVCCEELTTGGILAEAYCAKHPPQSKDAMPVHDDMCFHDEDAVDCPYDHRNVI